MILASLVALTAQATYRVQDLGLPPQWFSRVSFSRVWITSAGSVLVHAHQGTGYRNALVKNGRVYTLPSDFRPADMNDREEVVGTRYVKLKGQPALWRNGKLSVLGSQQWYPEGINNKGVVAGTLFIERRDARDQMWACLWRNGKLTRLAGMPKDSEAYDCNDKEEVLVGWPKNNTMDAPFYLGFWRKGTAKSFHVGRQFSLLGSQCSNRGDAIGSINGIEWSDGLAYINGKTEVKEGYNLTLGLNNRGDVVGGHSYWPADGGPQEHLQHYALLWRGGSKYKLQDLVLPDFGWKFDVAGAINDRGQIVGFGRHYGKPGVFLVSPVGG